MDLGYDKENLICLNMNDEVRQNLVSLKNKLLQHPLLKQNYQLVTLPIGAGIEYLTFYLRKDQIRP